MLSDVFDTDMSDIVISPDFFSDPNNKKTAAAIEALRAKDMPVSEEFVTNALIKNRAFNEQHFMWVLSATPYASKDIVEKMVATLKEERKKTEWEVI